MNQQDILDVIVNHAREVVPELETHDFQPTDSLRALGANSVDRADIIMMTLESLSLSIPLNELASAANIGELAGLIHAKA
ncbi:MAG: acyl carrier protein [Xanthomonadales bacterium]|nr:acyl carrier protein [Xanthomonadales bacterium]